MCFDSKRNDTGPRITGRVATPMPAAWRYWSTGVAGPRVNRCPVLSSGTR